MVTRRKTIGVFAIAFLAVVGLGLASATIDSTYSPSISGSGGGPGSGSGDGPGTGPGNGNDQNQGEAPGGGSDGSQSPLEIPEICVEFLTTAPGVLLLIGGILLAIVIAYRQSGFVAGAFVGYLLGLPAVIGYGLVTQCGGTPGNPGDTRSPLQDVLSAFPETGSAVASPVPPELLIGVFALAAVLAVVGLFFATGSEDIEPEITEEEEPDTDLEEFAAAAGEAADRIESKDASVDNAVYRAWQEMTALLNLPNPDVSTAGMFADAAIEAGVDEADVNQLTQLFEEVRYGDMDPEPREELALETLRGIENQYGEPGDAPEDTDDSTDDGGEGS